MGFAKYHEDNLEIYDERMYYRNSSSLPSVKTSYTRTTPKIRTLLIIFLLRMEAFTNLYILTTEGFMIMSKLLDRYILLNSILLGKMQEKFD